jgi:hypothetical protein
MVRITAFVVAATLLSSLPAAAQAVAVERPNPPVRVNLSLSVFVPGAVAEADDPKLRQARRSLYELAGRECELLRDVLAKDCRLEGIQVNLNRQHQYGRDQLEGFLANANVNLQITPK